MSHTGTMQRLGRMQARPTSGAPIVTRAERRGVHVIPKVIAVDVPTTSTPGDDGKERSPEPQAPAKAPVNLGAYLTPQQQLSLGRRHRSVARHFPNAMGIDDFMARLEVALNGFGFTGDNAIAMTNLCRDEVTTVLKDKIEAVFGSSFNTNGLGAVLTCGLTGMGAGFSHSPISNGKEHYVFFAFPHIGINSAGEVGAIARPGRPVKSCACGALQKCLIELKAEGYKKHCKVPGVHDASDPEYSILKQRLARRVRFEGLDPTQMNLVDITHVAERTITNDLEFLIEKAVDTSKANYAVVTGTQIHNWATDLTSTAAPIPSLEFVAPAKVFVVLDGQKYHIDLTRVPTMSPRQLQVMAKASLDDKGDDVIIGTTVGGTLKEIPIKYLTQRLGVTKDQEDEEDLSYLNDGEEGVERPVAWQNHIVAEMAGFDRDPHAPTMESFEEQERFTSFRVLGGFGAMIGTSGSATGVPWPPSI